MVTCLRILREPYKPQRFFIIYYKGDNFCDSLFALKAFSKKGSTLKGKNLLPLGVISLLLEKTPFQKGLDVQESKHEVIKTVSLAEKMAIKIVLCASSPSSKTIRHHQHHTCEPSSTLTFSMLGRNLSRRYFKYFHFFQKNKVDISCKIFSLRYSLHDMSNPIFLWKTKKEKFAV